MENETQNERFQWLTAYPFAVFESQALHGDQGERIVTRTAKVSEKIWITFDYYFTNRLFSLSSIVWDNVRLACSTLSL